MATQDMQAARTPKGTFAWKSGTLVALTVADIGNAIPYGLASGPYSNRLNAAEWILSALFAVAAILLILRLLHRISGKLATLISAGCWAASTSYVFWVPHSTIRERAGIGLIFAGLVVLSLFAYAREVYTNVQLG